MTVFWSAEIATSFINIRNGVQKHNGIAAVTPTVFLYWKVQKNSDHFVSPEKTIP